MLRSWKNKFRLARQLTRQDWLMLAEAWLGLFSMAAALKRSSLERLLERKPFPHGSSPGQPPLELARQAQRLVRYAARLHPLRSTCLVEALTLRAMLARRGLPAEIKIGVLKTPAGLRAHAWLEVAGQIVGEPAEIDQRFKVLAPM